jgi:dipeptidyl aminopeptidase/acylaminoacyl peptidase
MRVHRRSFLAGLAAGCLHLPESVRAQDVEPRLIREDYAVARTHFRTRLQTFGPSPDEAPPLAPPSGPRTIGYRSGSLDLTAWISTDGGDRTPRPAVLFLHGGNALWPGHWDLAKPYLDAGYVVMMPALRAENGLPGAFSGFYDETADVLAAAEHLRALPGIDAERLFLAGHSIGGTLTMLAAMSTPVFRAAASFSGNPDARAFFRRFPEDVRFDTADPLEFDMRSAACFAGSFKCPVLMLHASKEHSSDKTIRLTVERARAAGLNVQRGVIDGDHGSALPGESAESLRFFAAL